MVKRTFASIKNLLLKEQNEIISAAAMLMVLSLFTKTTGMVFLSLFAREFGATAETDIFYMASVIPETITNIILMGAISGSIIPIFISLKEDKGEKDFIESFSSTFNLSMLFFIFLSLVAGIFAKQLIPIAVDMTQRQEPLTAEQVDQIVSIMRVLLFPQVILAVSAFISTTLNIYHRFIIPQLAPLFYNIGRIIGVVVLVPLLDGSIWGLIWGIILGAVLHLVVQLPLMNHLRIKFMYGYIDLKDKYFKQVLQLGFPRVLSLSAEQAAVITDSLIAFGLTIGALSTYQLGVRLISFPLGLLGTSYAIAAFPSLSKLYAKGAKEEFSQLVVKIINQVLFLAIPLAVIMLVLRVPIVRLVYGLLDGNFDWNDTLQVAWVVMFFSIGLAFETLRSAMFRVYYSIHNSWVPMVSSIFVVVLGVVTGILFTNYLSHFDSFSLRELSWNLSYFTSKGEGSAGVGGLALSSSLVFTLEFFFLLFGLVQLKAITDVRDLVFRISKKLLAGFTMLVVSYAMAKLWEQILNTEMTLQLIILTISTVISTFMFYIWTSFVMNVEEVEVFVGFIARSLKKVFRK
ncbi:hypothetical protein KC909_01970 [Candidatus Dojkabacteria bacterium]|uniref:Lipid II flippase MurJ n=1 Tax=Candidatus Dojkabacteria bacterium TaxID=2099670 RepID=A0A955L557_9BACT|nr:hypothetical protein [Candidatus Dojkabacteria bacterium]